MDRSKSLAVSGILVWAVVGLLVTGISSAAVASKVIARGTLVKGHLIGIAEGTAKSPKGVSFTITSKPSQRVKIDWSIVCAHPLADATIGESGQSVTSDTQEQAGVFSATTPVSRTLPLTVKHPAACIVNVYGTLSEHGSELIEILQD